MAKAKLIGISRLRMGTDGHGVTTLLGFHGCPLRCKYCLNPQCWGVGDKCLELSPEEVYNKVKKDELYFISTSGGLTLGGGEPLLQSEFIKEVLELGAKNWHTTIETSLNVPQKNIELLFPFIEEYVIDIKDMNTSIYKSYCGIENDRVKTNLQWLVNHGKSEIITCRIPLIPGYNTEEERQRNKKELEDIGISHFDLFTYKTNIKK